MPNKMRALVVGVSKYESIEIPNLPECENDSKAVDCALQRDCFFNSSDIQVLTGKISLDDFKLALDALLSYDADITVLYFSGHGTLSENHEASLVLSNGLLQASSVVERCQRACKTSWLIFDMCHAGAIPFNTEQWGELRAEANEGCVLFASCAPDMASYIDEDSIYSAFTDMLVKAIGITRCREGIRSLSDIERALHCLVKVRNQSTSNQQQPILFHSSVGPIMFFDPNFKPYQWHAEQLPETNLFKVMRVEPCFADRKRYSCKVVAKTLLDYKTLVQGLPELIRKLSVYETYDTEAQQRRWEGKQTQVLFIYFAANDTDFLNALFPFCATWSIQGPNEKIARGAWCEEAQCWIKEQWTPSGLDEMRHLYEEGAISDGTAIQQAQDSLNKIATCASKIFKAGDRWLGGLISTDRFSEVIEANREQIEKGLKNALQIGYPSEKLRPLENQIIDLAGALRDIPSYFLDNGRAGRTEENLKQCFDIARRRYDDARLKIAEIINSEAE